jgi:hypothetical protein
VPAIPAVQAKGSAGIADILGADVSLPFSEENDAGTVGTFSVY